MKNDLTPQPEIKICIECKQSKDKKKDFKPQRKVCIDCCKQKERERTKQKTNQYAMFIG